MSNSFNYVPSVSLAKLSLISRLAKNKVVEELKKLWL